MSLTERDTNAAGKVGVHVEPHIRRRHNPGAIGQGGDPFVEEITDGSSTLIDPYEKAAEAVFDSQRPNGGEGADVTSLDPYERSVARHELDGLVDRFNTQYRALREADAHPEEVVDSLMSDAMRELVRQGHPDLPTKAHKRRFASALVRSFLDSVRLEE